MKVCIIGSSGQLGLHLFNKFKNNNRYYFFSSKKTKPSFIKGGLYQINQLVLKLKKIKPSVIINCSAYTNVDRAEIEKKKANIINFKSVQILSKFCYENQIILIHFSTDYVYSGRGKNMWRENSICKPINYYGLTKYKGEKSIIESNCQFIILRLSWLYGFYGKENFIIKIIKIAKLNKKISMVTDQFGSPTSTELVVFVLKKILIKIDQKKFKSGIFNLCPEQDTNRYELSNYIFNNYFNKKFLKRLEIDKINTKNLNLVARRPLNSRMKIDKISKFLNIEIKNWKFYLDKYLNHIKGKI